MPSSPAPPPSGLRIQPFRAVRYDPAQADDLSQIICPPYVDSAENGGEIGRRLGSATPGRRRAHAARGAGSYDEPMTSAECPTSRRPVGRGFVLLVLAVLAGVLAMHGLGSKPMPAAASHPGQGRHAVAVPHEEATHQADGNCSHSAGGSEHLDHADATCAAAGVGSPYAPPPLIAAMDAPLPAAVLLGVVPASAEGGRAPPDLSELQLLRI